MWKRYCALVLLLCGVTLEARITRIVIDQRVSPAFNGAASAPTYSPTKGRLHLLRFIQRLMSMPPGSKLVAESSKVHLVYSFKMVTTACYRPPDLIQRACMLGFHCLEEQLQFLHTAGTAFEMFSHQLQRLWQRSPGKEMVGIGGEILETVVAPDFMGQRRGRHAD